MRKCMIAALTAAQIVAAAPPALDDRSDREARLRLSGACSVERDSKPGAGEGALALRARAALIAEIGGPCRLGGDSDLARDQGRHDQ